MNKNLNELITDIDQWFRAIQFRSPTQEQITLYADALSKGQMSIDDVLTEISNDPYTINHVNPIIKLYQAAFNRVPDHNGQAFWVNELRSGNATLSDICASFANSDEFFKLYAKNTHAAISPQFLTALYETTLQREPDWAGFSFWLQSGMNVGQVLYCFVNSPEFSENSINPIKLYQASQANNSLPTDPTALWHFTAPEVPKVETAFAVENNQGVLSFTGYTTGDIFFTIAENGKITFTRQGYSADNKFEVASISYASPSIKLANSTSTISIGDAQALESIKGFDANDHTYSVIDTATNILSQHDFRHASAYKLNSNVIGFSIAEVRSLTDIIGFDANGYSFRILDSANNLLASQGLSNVSAYLLSSDATDLSLSRATALFSMTGFDFNGHFYTIQDTISEADGLDFSVGYSNLRGVNLSASNGNQIVIGTEYADTIDGGTGNDEIHGRDGHDTLIGGAGSDYLVGDTGIDIAVYSGNMSDYQVQIISATTATLDDLVSGRDGSDSLSGVERIRFNDQSLALDLNGAPGQIFLSYWLATGQSLDAVDMGFYLAQSDEGIPVTSIAEAFIAGGPITAMSNTEFLDMVFLRALGRSQDPEGIDYWNSILNNGIGDRADVLVWIAIAVEHSADPILNTLVGNSITYQEWV